MFACLDAKCSVCMYVHFDVDVQTEWYKHNLKEEEEEEEGDNFLDSMPKESKQAHQCKIIMIEELIIRSFLA